MSEEKTEEKEIVNSLKIKNTYIEKLISFLDTPLHGQEARARNRFVSIIGKQLVFLTSERQRLLEEKTKKDEKGKPILIDDGKKYDISPEDLTIVNEELAVLFNEDYIIDILPSNKSDIKVVSEIILNSTKEFDLSEGAVYDEICKVFENLKHE